MFNHINGIMRAVNKMTTESKEHLYCAVMFARLKVFKL